MPAADPPDPTPVTIRLAELPRELPRIRQLYCDAARVTARGHYTPAQIAAWTSGAEDTEAFAALFADSYTLVACVGEALVAVGQLRPWDHLALLYTDPAWNRRGIGARLVQALESEARRHGVRAISVTASALSLPLFQRLGYELVDEEDIVYQGADFHRWKLLKRLPEADSAP